MQNEMKSRFPFMAFKKWTAGIKYMLFIGCWFLLAGAASAQEKKITGKVTDANGQPVAGASVTIKGKRTGVVADNTGMYTISANTGDVLVFSNVGYASTEVKVGADNTVNISLAVSSGNLNEVVIIGYGSSRKKDLTGSITTVTAKDFQRGTITTPEQLIAGKVAGVSVISNDGRPGSGSQIRVRGGSSLSASSDPLIVIDGIPLENSGIAGSANALSFINPNDIESFTVLKDASAAAIYGTRGANGVIIITTKKGTSGKLKMSFYTNESVSVNPKEVSVLSADQFRQVINAKGSAAQIAMMGAANTDWQKQIYQTAFATDNNLSFSGGIKKLPYRLSLGYVNQSGILKTDNLERESITIMLNPVLLNNHLKVDINWKGSMESTRFAANVIGGAITFDPTQPVYATKSPQRFGGYYEWLDATTATGLSNLAGRNPLGILKQTFDQAKPKRGIGNIQLDYKFPFLPDLHAVLNMGYDASTGSGTIKVSDSAASAYVAGGKGGTNNYYKTTKSNSVLDFYFNYVKDLKSIKSRVDATAGYSYNHYLTTVYNYASYYYNGTKVPNSDPTYPLNKPENNVVSFFGRVKFGYDNKYLLTATFRRDGASVFGPSNRWGNFPSAAIAWKIKEEPFLKNNRTVSDLGLRFSYGITGQKDGMPYYGYLSFYNLSLPNAEYQFGNNYYQMYRPGGYNPDIKWEQTGTTNAGLDFGFLDQRITGNLDFYINKTKDLLVNIPQPAGSNFVAFYVANVGNMENKGVEFALNGQIIRKRDLTWSAGFNISYNKNHITNMTASPNDQNFRGIQVGNIAGGIGGGFAQILAVGYSKNTFNLYRQVYDSTGKPLEGVFVDKNGDGIINQNDLYKSKSAVPDVFMGFTTSVVYKRWSAGFVLRASIGNYVYNNIYSNNGSLKQLTGNSVLYNASTNYLDTRFLGNSDELLSDYYIQNASFLKMDNLTVGYNFGKVYHKKVDMRVFAGVQNVFVITNYKGLDPEVSSGIDNNLYPRPRIFSLGANLDF